MRTTDHVRAPLACEQDPELFFPLATTGATNQRQIARAQQACEACPRKIPCGQEALGRNEPTLSIYGGLLFPRPPLQRTEPLDPAIAAFLPRRPKDRARRRDAVDLEQLAFLESFGMSRDRIAAELGVTPDGIDRLQQRERAKQRLRERDLAGARFAAAHVTAARLLDAARYRAEHPAGPTAGPTAVCGAETEPRPLCAAS